MRHPLVSCAVVLLVGMPSLSLAAYQEKEQLPQFDFQAARKHEASPHRWNIPTEGFKHGYEQLHLTLTVSPSGDVVDADATGEPQVMKFWPNLKDEVLTWKYRPFEVDEKPVRAKVEGYINIVPPERLPTKHVVPPLLKDDSKITITLVRTGCFGSCPAYKVILTNQEVTFEARSYAVAQGVHHADIGEGEVRALAKQIVAADFYSMDPVYRAMVTDNPTYVLTISVDGKEKEVEDYVGEWVGMPAIISDLEQAVDKVAQTDRWLQGSEGLVDSLKDEEFDFTTFDAQAMLRQAAMRGQAATVKELLDAGVVQTPLTPEKSKQNGANQDPFQPLISGFLAPAAAYPEVLEVLIGAGLSHDDQHDKDVALEVAARNGSVKSFRMLVKYGANPNLDMSKLFPKEKKNKPADNDADADEDDDDDDLGPGSLLISAAASTNPEMVREVLQYKPDLEVKDQEGKTALLAAGEAYNESVPGGKLECVKILADAGAQINAHDKDGNTVLHETVEDEVELEMLKRGADVNARNYEGETPLFTTYNFDSMHLLIEAGADLNERNNAGKSVLEAAQGNAERLEALREAISRAGSKRKN